jgi:hypothetical protein
MGAIVTVILSAADYAAKLLDLYAALHDAAVNMPSPYLTAGGFEIVMDQLESTYTADLCRVTTFPNLTQPDARKYSFLEIGSRKSANRETVLIVAGLHGREWAQSDAALSFADKLLHAYQAGTAFSIPAYTDDSGTTRGPVDMPDTVVTAVVDELDIILVPLANPDGRAYTEDKDHGQIDWRKNRGHRPAGSADAIGGVDLNRNFDIAWDCDVYYDNAFLTAPEASKIVESKDPSSLVFRGDEDAKNPHHPKLEPETANLVWLVDNHQITFAIDLHAAGPNIMYPWGIEGNGKDPSQTFLKVGPRSAGGWDLARDGVGPLPTDRSLYSEYFPASLLLRHGLIAHSIQNRIQDTTGRTYVVGPPARTYYPATGTLMDYIFSRQFVIANTPPTCALTVEFGEWEAPEGLQPKPIAYPRIEREVHATLLAFLEAALNRLLR